MRPPEFTGGNRGWMRFVCTLLFSCFNEAAGIHRRKPDQMRVALVKVRPLQ